ncbi:CDP-diacylglycerol--inositol 3-phosphatidyltransferase-like [Gordionus sp. m RMFG-2023]|uniref:CDP-diacylglycerol--inositol 3-phosphatidyltransferase-like n=1 Tax=Gordionus sp. m RMFG-2023 TaxID=3053472 RepID=UPI0031FD1990
MDIINNFKKSDNIYIFIPNLLGYIRIILAIFSIWFMPYDYKKAIILYVSSELLDAFDGYAARYFKQSTHFGAMLDMLTDRCCTLVLLTVLCSFYPRWAFLFQLSICLDICSHWIHIYSSSLVGKTHKTISPSGNRFMKIYYSSRVLLFCMCAGNELFYASLYLLNFNLGPKVMGIPCWLLMLYMTLPICIAKTILNLIQMIKACQFIVDYDVSERTKK